MNAELIQNLRLFSPELILLGVLIILFLLDSFYKSARQNYLPLVITLSGTVIAAVATYSISREPNQLFFGMLSNDSFTSFFRYLFLLSGAAGLYLGFGSKALLPKHRMEFTLLLVSVLIGMSLMATSVNLLALYLGIETVSILSFVMAGFSDDDLRANEASLKYFIFGGFSSALMVFGISLLYGYAGSIQYADIAKFIFAQGELPFICLMALGLIYAGLAYKISAFPMHFWTPDVYEGAPTPVVAFFSVGPKAAGFAAFIRFFVEVLSMRQTGSGFLWQFSAPAAANWIPVIAIIAAITMTLGNLSAIGQRNAKRILAYSSIAHVGYMLMGFVAADAFGIGAILFYTLVYIIMNLGAFWVVSVVEDSKGHTDLDAFSGVGWQMPVLGTCMAIFLFSLTGIPMFSGFAGKFILFGAVVKTQGYMWLAVIGVLNSVVSLYYYAKILKPIWFEQPPVGSSVRLSFYHGFALIALAVPTILLGIFFSPLVNLVSRSLTLGTF